MESSARSTGATVLRVLAVVARVVATLLLVLVVVDCVATGSLHSELLSLNGAVTRAIPSVISGVLVMQTPLGGAFRGDFLITAMILYVLGWLFSRVAASLR